MKHIILFTMLVAPNAFAEVSDKIPTKSSMWLWATAVSIVPVVTLPWSKWVNIIALPVLFSFVAFAVTVMLSDIWSSIFREQGFSYIIALWGSSLLVLLAVVFGNLISKRRRVSGAQ